MLNEFVPVRILNFKGVDMNLFQFDYDLTFAVLMMNANGFTYSRFGSQDANSATDRVSIAGLKRAMREVLVLHKNAAGRDLKPEARPPFTLMDIPSFASSKQANSDCYHCHFANNFRLKELRKEGKFTKDMLFQYPLPENLGITLDIDANNTVKSVISASPAEKAVLRAGDTVVAANTARVLTSADLQFALHPVRDEGTVDLVVLRDGKAIQRTLRLPKGWRKTDISWRASAEVASPIVGIWAEALKPEDKAQRGIEQDKLALRVSFFFPGEKWAKSRGDLRLNDVIIGINSEMWPHLNTRQFHSKFRLDFNVGDTVTLNVLRGAERLDISVPCIEVEE